MIAHLVREILSRARGVKPGANIMSMYGPRTELVPVVRFYAGYSEKLVVAIDFPPDSPYTDQSQKDDADINTIMNRYMATGELPYLNEGNPQWADLTGVDFQDALHLIMEAEERFGELPSAIRDRFQNDPGA